MKLNKPLILASQSPRRKELLRQFHIPFEVIPANIDETPDPDIHYALHAQEIAARKASKVLETRSEAIIIAADTMVFLDKTHLGKPSDKNEAIDMLTNLSDTTHEVITGVSIQSKEHSHNFSANTKVRFSLLTTEEIEWYITHFNPYDKAGAYGIQDWIGLMKVIEIKGSYTNVVGLPVAQLYAALQSFNPTKIQ